MKHIIIILVFGLISQVSAFSQGIIDFNINFGNNPPPHLSGLSDGGAKLESDLFYAAIYLSDLSPTSGSIVEKSEGGAFTPIFQFGSPVLASYSNIGTAFSYEHSWQLTDSQIQSLLAGQWYAEVTYGDTIYMGQITSVPEPASFALLSGGLAVFLAYRRCGAA